MDTFIEVGTCTASDFRVRIPQLDEAIKFMALIGSKYSVIEPHVTLLLNPSTQDQFEKAAPLLRSYLSSLEAFEINLGELVYEEKSRFLKVAIVSEKVKEIHQRLLEIVGEIRHGEIRAKDLQRIKDGKYTTDEIEHLKKYGFIFTGDRFNQHITIGNIPEGINEQEMIEKVKIILGPALGRKVLVEELNLMFHTDAPTQAEMKELVFETIKLQPILA